MILKVGNKVRLKTYKELLETYSKRDSDDIPNMPFGYIPSYMNTKLETIVTIESISDTNYAKLSRIKLKNLRYSWHKDMFKPLTKKINLKNIYIAS